MAEFSKSVGAQASAAGQTEQWLIGGSGALERHPRWHAAHDAVCYASSLLDDALVDADPTGKDRLIRQAHNLVNAAVLALNGEAGQALGILLERISAAEPEKFSWEGE